MRFLVVLTFFPYPPVSFGVSLWKLCLGFQMKHLNYGLEVWAPTYSDVTPVLTPCYPWDNCASTVSPSSWAVILSEVNRARALCEQCFSKGNGVDLAELWETSPFLIEFPAFLCVEVCRRDFVDSRPLPHLQSSHVSVDSFFCGLLALVDQLSDHYWGIWLSCHGFGFYGIYYWVSFPFFLVNVTVRLAQVTAVDEEDFLRWSGLVDSRIRFLTAELHAIPTLSARLFPRRFRFTPSDSASGPAPPGDESASNPELSCGQKEQVSSSSGIRTPEKKSEVGLASEQVVGTSSSSQSNEQTEGMESVSSTAAEVAGQGKPEECLGQTDTLIKGFGCRWIIGMQATKWTEGGFVEIDEAIEHWKSSIVSSIKREQKTFHRTPQMKGPSVRMVQQDVVGSLVQL